jgi:SOS response regulatory protein OraA/RecX
MATKTSATYPNVESLLSAKSLQQIANCLAYLVVNSGDLKGKNKQDLMPILSDLGFDRNAIAGVLQTTPESVSVRLSQLKAAKKSGKKKSADISNGENQPSITE